MSIVEINSLADYISHITSRSDNKLVILQYYMPTCGYCKKVVPHYKALAKGRPDIVLYVTNINKATDLAAEQNVNATPFFQAYRNGKLIGTVNGADMEGLGRLAKL